MVPGAGVTSSVERIRTAARWGLAVFFIVAGLNHFRTPSFYLPMMPAYMPAHDLLIALSGMMEIAGGIATLVPRLRRVAGWFLTLLLLAILPANIEMAVHPELFPAVPQWALYLRLPFQIVLIGWALWATGGATRAHDLPSDESGSDPSPRRHEAP